MREIKFRAWDEELGVMTYKPNIRRNDDDEIIAEAYDIHEDYYELTLMQYTDLKDKNGKEIYEGDIVKSGGNWGEVFFDSKGCYFKSRIDHKENGNCGLNVDKDYIEIIGNIYENPELLK